MGWREYYSYLISHFFKYLTEACIICVSPGEVMNNLRTLKQIAELYHRIIMKGLTSSADILICNLPLHSGHPITP